MNRRRYTILKPWPYAKIRVPRKKKMEPWKFWLFIALPICIFITCFIGHGYALADQQAIEVAKAQNLMATNSAIIAQVITQNTKLRTDLKVASAAADVAHPTLSYQAFDTIVHLVMPAEAATRYEQIVTKCENSSRNPLAHNTNKNGSVDIGVSQINSVHSGQVQAMFNENFLNAMTDSVKNIVFAAWMYRNAHNFDAWTCNRLV